MFLWLAGSLVFAAFYKPLRQGPKMAYLTLVSFVLLVTALCVGLFVRHDHGGNRARSPQKPTSAVFRPGD